MATSGTARAKCRHLSLGTPHAQQFVMPHRDRSIAVLCLIAFALCAALFVGTEVLCAVSFLYWGRTAFVAETFVALAAAIGGATTVALTRANSRGNVTEGCVFVCVAGLCVALVVSTIALAGERIWWAVYMLDDLASAMHFLHVEVIAPPLLFGALIAALGWRGWLVARRTARDVARRLDPSPTA